MEITAQYIEALIFSAGQPISLKEIKQCLEAVFESKFKQEAIQDLIDQLIVKYQQEAYVFELLPIAGGYQFLTKGIFHHVINTYIQQHNKKRLSRSALETLAIIAYKQPVVKMDIEKIRGVGCDYSIQKLLEKELISITGRSDAPGRPLLYGTSDKFMNYFGIQSLKDLPKLKDFKNASSEIGSKDA